MVAANFLKAYVAYASARTAAPLLFHQFAGLTVLAAALGNRVFVDAGGWLIYPSLWTCLIGPSHSRKTTAVNLAASLLYEADATIELPHDFTREAFYDQLAARPYGLLRWREMGSVLKSLKREYNAGLAETLTDFWDHPATVKRRTKGSGEVQIHRPAISILAAAKPRWFMSSITEEDIEGGFLGRWLFIASTEENGTDRFWGAARTAAEEEQRCSLVEHLRLISQLEGEISRGEAEPIIGRWAVSFGTQHRGEDRDPADFADRAGTQVTKLAIAIMAARGIEEFWSLHPKAAEQAITIYEDSYRCSQELVSQVLGQSKDSAQIEHVYRLIKNEGEITRSALLRRTRLQVKTLNAIVETLVDAERVSWESLPPTSSTGRRKMVYRPA